MFRQLFSQFLQALPSQCAVCHAWPSQALCEACVKQFAPPLTRCQTCALHTPSGQRQCGACIRHPPPLDQALAGVSYVYPWARLITEFKFHAHTGWARSFATLLRATAQVNATLESSDVLIPMPLSKERLKLRGFNQAVLLARALETDKVQTDLLLRIQDTPPQSSLQRKERLTRVQNAFAVNPLRIQHIKNHRVMLVDDVMTSGASLHAAARTLRQAGAIHIESLVFARTEFAH